MKDFILVPYIFTPGPSGVGTIALTINNFDVKYLVAIINQTRGVTIYATGSTATRYTSILGSTLTLNVDTSTHLSTDTIQVIYNDVNYEQPVTLGNGTITANGAVAVGNATSKFRDNFIFAQPDTNVWDANYDNLGMTFLDKGGNTAGVSYLRICVDPFQSTEFIMTSKESFKFPTRLVYALSQSQRVLGQELEISLVGVNDVGVVETGSELPSQAISGNVTITSNVATINFATPHSFKGGDRVQISGCTDFRLNVVPVSVTVVTNTQITVPITLANGTYTAGGIVTCINAGYNNNNTTGFLFENTTATNGTFYVKRNGESVRQINATVATSTATQLNTSPYCDAFNAGSINDIIPSLQDVVYTSTTADGTVGPSGILRYNLVPDEEKEYKIRIRARTHDSMTRPIAKIVSISKSGTTTATVTTDVPHNLTTSSFVQIQGVRNITNFPALASTQVASIVSPTQFTIVIGSAVTATSAGGMVIAVYGSVAHVGSTGLAVQSIVRTNNIMTITVNTTATGALPGEFWHLYGCDAVSMGNYDGVYKIMRMTGSTYEVESIGDNFTSINCGGSFIKRTDHRIHNIQMLEYTRHIVELSSQNGSLDATKSLPVNISTPIPTVSTVSTVSAVSAVTTISAVTSANLGSPLTVADIASAALTTTTTTSAITPASGLSYVVNMPVTAVTGTTPTLDVAIEESDDGGTNWYKVYDFPRITATGMYRSPKIAINGNRIRYVQTVGGTSPSFTRSLNRLQANDMADPIRQLIDRSVVLTTLNSNTPSLNVQNCRNVQLMVNVGAITTTAPQLQLQGSDDNGLTWYSIGTPVTAVASSTVQSITTNIHTQFIRVTVSTAGVGVTAGYVLIKGF